MPRMLHLERPADGEPVGLLVLHHGRGTGERDLLGLGEALDPDHRLHVVSPRGPLQLPGWPGYHWYRVQSVGHPDRESFQAAVQQLGAFHDELWQGTGIAPERTVLGGFSMGAVMSYAMGLGPGRPAPAGILAFSGFLPSVEGWEPALADRAGLPVFIAHGTRDPVIDVSFGRSARMLLEQGGLAVEYHESQVDHQIAPRSLAQASDWLAAALRLQDGRVA